MALGLQCPWLAVLGAPRSCWKPRVMLVPGSASEMLLKDPSLLLEFSRNVGQQCSQSLSAHIHRAQSRVLGISVSLLAQFWSIPSSTFAASPWEELRLGPGHRRGRATSSHDSAAHLLPASLIPTSPKLSFQAFISSSHCYSSVHLNILILGEGGLGSSVLPLLPQPPSLAYLPKAGPGCPRPRWVRQIVEGA